MSCDRYATAIADHACGADLAPDAAAHLRTCAACAARLASHRRAIDGLDGELQQLLAVEPSAHFVPRVQAHLSAVPAPRGWSTLAWSGLAAAAAAGIIVWTLPSTGPVHTPAAPAPTAVSRASAPEIPRQEDTPRPPPVSSRARRTRSAPVNAQPSKEPEIIVPEDQQRAVARFVALVRTGRLDTSSLATQTDSEIAPPAELGVSPLAVSPIAIPSVEFGAHPVANDGMPKGVEPR